MGCNHAMFHSNCDSCQLARHQDVTETAQREQVKAQRAQAEELKLQTRIARERAGSQSLSGGGGGGSMLGVVLVGAFVLLAGIMWALNEALNLVWPILEVVLPVAFVAGLVLLVVRGVRQRGAVAAATPAVVPKAGWYPDPTREAAWRWWDGRAWTGWTQ